jgi:NitT/TauT family transport system substrate-binding protein
MKWIAAGFLSLLSALAPHLTKAADLERSDISLGVGGRALLYYLPLTIAETKGYFKEEGLDVTINDLKGGSQALQSLLGGSADAVTGAYEHTIRMQMKGQNIKAVIELGRFPGIVLGVRKDLAGQIKSPADLKGRKIAVTAPGSSTAMFAAYLIAKAGLRPEDVVFAGVGGGPGAVAAVKSGNVDAICNLEPVISTLERDGLVSILADTRTEEGTARIFGGTNPAAVLYLKDDFIGKNPKTVQALVNAFYKALKFIEKASPEEIAASVPEEYYLNDKQLYVTAVKNSKPAYSRSGFITPDGMKAALELLSYDPAIPVSGADTAKTFDGRFVKNASLR